MGFLSIAIPEEHGGLGLGYLELCAVAEEFGRAIVPLPILSTVYLAAEAIKSFGTVEQQAAWLPRLAAAQAIGTLAVDESGKHRPQTLATTARADGNGWVLDGAKTLVLDGHVADLFIVAARVGEMGMGLFLVAAGTAGVQVERTVMVDAHNAARVRFEAVRLGADALLGTVEAGSATLAATLNAGRCAAAAELLGLADEVFARTVDYIKQRKQFGKLIGEFQALQHRAATLYADLEISRAALMGAQQALDADIHTAGKAVAVAKARAGRTATTAVQEGVQMHGGMGMTDAFEIGFFMKRARVLQELWGDHHFHTDAFASHRGY